MTRALTVLSASVAAAFALAGPAAAQTGPAPGEGMMGLAPPAALTEVPAWAGRLFDRLDADQDGFITGQEMAVLSRGPMASMGGGALRRVIAQSDASNDGRITRDELVAGAERMFRRLDADGDGVLSDSERPRPPAPPRPVTVPMPAPEPMPMPGMEDMGG